MLVPGFLEAGEVEGMDPVLYSAIRLRACYNLPGTDMLYSATSRSSTTQYGCGKSVPCSRSARYRLLSYYARNTTAVSGTDYAYDPTSP